MPIYRVSVTVSATADVYVDEASAADAIAYVEGGTGITSVCVGAEHCAWWDSVAFGEVSALEAVEAE